VRTASLEGQVDPLPSCTSLPIAEDTHS
jgi:hypothetical protein